MDEIRRDWTDMQALEARCWWNARHMNRFARLRTIDRYCGNIRGHYHDRIFMCG